MVTPVGESGRIGDVVPQPEPRHDASDLLYRARAGQAPRFIVRDRDRVYGGVFARRVRVMGIRDRPIAPHSAWQNGCAERLIGSIRRDCLDPVVVFGEPQVKLALCIHWRTLRSSLLPILRELRKSDSGI